jgi:hypothetical protein
MKVETTISQLKRLNESYKSLAERYARERDDASVKFVEFSNLVAQTSDALDALEGRPSLKQQLEQALSQSQQVSQQVSERRQPAMTANDDISHLPVAEPGFNWKQNEAFEWVLVPAGTQISESARTAIPLILPNIMDDEQFGDKPEDLL